MLPINRPLVEASNNNQNGKMDFAHRKGDIKYAPSGATGRRDEPAAEESLSQPVATVQAKPIDKPLNFKQAGELYQSFTDTGRANLIKNLFGDLNRVKDDKIKLRITAFCYLADPEYGERLAKELKIGLDDVKADAKKVK